MAGRSQTYTFNDVLSLTMWTYHQTGTLADNIFKGMPWIEHLHSKGRVEKKRGGERILVPLMYAKSPNAGSYAGYDVLATAPQDGFTTVEFNWKQSADSIIISGRELRAIGNPIQLKDLLKARTELSELSLMDVLNTQAYSDGTGNNGKNLTGLEAIIAVDGQGTYAGIDATQAANAWWRNYFQSGIGSFAANGRDAMRKAWRKISQGRRSGISDLILCTSDAYGFYEATLESKERFVLDAKPSPGQVGFGPLTYKGIPLMFDENAPLISAQDWMKWINSRYLQLIVHPDADFSPTAFKTPPAQDASVAQILFQGEIVCSNRRHQGGLFGITA